MPKGSDKMKIKKGFMLRKVGAQNIVVAVGAESRNFNGIIRLNDTGKFLWEKLRDETTEEELLSAMTNEYDIDSETAKNDISAFIETLKGAGLLA